MTKCVSLRQRGPGYVPAGADGGRRGTPARGHQHRSAAVVRRRRRTPPQPSRGGLLAAGSGGAGEAGSVRPAQLPGPAIPSANRYLRSKNFGMGNLTRTSRTTASPNSSGMCSGHPQHAVIRSEPAISAASDEPAISTPTAPFGAARSVNCSGCKAFVTRCSCLCRPTGTSTTAYCCGESMARTSASASKPYSP